jgi:ATP-dependent RNA helicase DDX31/DBP7
VIHKPGERDDDRPMKRKKTFEGEQTAKEKPQSTRPQGQVVSSLFTSNPALPKIGNHGTVSQKTPQVLVEPSNAPLTDSSTFGDLGLDPLLISHIEVKLSITKPTSIQRASLPILLSPHDPRMTVHDVLIQADTGSGKTLSYLLPIVQDLLPLCSLSYVDRSIGTLAIIVAPTRELAKQISEVLEQILQMRLRSTKEIPDGEDDEPRRTRWLVSGLLTGGATRTHEKARLRKGIPILVSTPGRLLDHLQNTTSFKVGKCRWLILDEADHLMELGFQETITSILKGLEGRRNLALRAAEMGQGLDNIGGWEWRQRRTILCSATIRGGVQKLAGFALKDPIVIKGAKGEDNRLQATPGETAARQPETFTPPSQLSQKYVLTPLKLRLVTLIALLRFLLRNAPQNHQGVGIKIIVFFSSTDSVDFHWRLLGQATMSASDTKDADNKDREGNVDSGGVGMTSALLPSTKVYRLHGSLPLATRLTSLQGFARVHKNINKGKDDQKEAKNSILFCTSVASRGLDLPFVRAVVQYDLPTEGGTTEYVHRVGRTARAGRGGEAWSLVCPSEANWVPWVEERMQGHEVKSKTVIKLEAMEVDSILQQGFGGKGSEYEDRATQVQLAFEHWVLKNAEVRFSIIMLLHAECHPQNASMARQAFQSHLRAYVTHPADEKHIFHVKNLHTGHLAKAFALRDAPSNMHSAKAKAHKRLRGRRPEDCSSGEDTSKVEQRMKEVVRAQGRLTKKAGQLASSGVSEYQIADIRSLEKMVARL